MSKIRKELDELKKKNAELEKEMASIRRGQSAGSSAVAESTLSHPSSSLRLGGEEVKVIIPAFNPSRGNGMAAEEWVNMVDNISHMYDWDDRSTLFYASLRLEEAASQWLAAQRGHITSWTQFKTSLVMDFPSSTDESDALVSLMTRRKRLDESYESYVYTMLALGRRGKFGIKSILRFIISGLGDRALMENVTMAKCASISELLELLKSLSKVRAQACSREKFDGSRSKGQERTGSFENNLRPFRDSRKYGRELPITCYKCKNIGHYARNCKLNYSSFNQPKSNANDFMQQTCFSCKQPGHFARNCRAAKRNPFTQLNGPPNKIRRLRHNQDDGGLTKNIKVGNFTVRAFLDLGADCSTLRSEDACKNNCRQESCNVTLNGFGGGTTSSMAKTHQMVTVGDVTMPIDIYIVDNNSQDVPMILGRNFLDSPRVRVIKEFGSLEVKNIEPPL